ncbi:MAG: amidohydrolase family protein [Acidobacteriota bacterium]|nr:amidohydrolase family protein [Acidobacteriota bacterium]
MKKFFALAWIILLPTLLAAQVNRAIQPSSLVFDQVTVIDLTGAPPKPDMAVVIRGNRIVSIGKSGRTRIPIALQAATLNPAEFFNKLASLGTIQKGKLADLVLLDANPLENIKNTKRINAVVANGRYFPKAALQQILDEVEAAASRQ